MKPAGDARICKDNLDRTLFDDECNLVVAMPKTYFQYGTWKNLDRDPDRRNISCCTSYWHTWENKARMNTQTQIRHHEKAGSEQILHLTSLFAEAVHSAEQFKLLGHCQFQAKRWEEALRPKGDFEISRFVNCHPLQTDG